MSKRRGNPVGQDFRTIWVAKRLAFAAFAALALFACITEKATIQEYLSWDIHASLSSYDSVEIVMFLPGDTAIVQERIWSGKLASDSELPESDLGRFNNKDFDVRIRGFMKGWLSYQSLVSRRKDSLTHLNMDPNLLPGGEPFLTDIALQMLKTARHLSPAFASGVTEYKVTCPFEDSAFRITVSAALAVKRITLNGDSMLPGILSGPLGLNVGSNEFLLRVYARKGDSDTYRLTAVREGNSEARLRSLSFGDTSISWAFSPDSFDYSLSVPSSTTDLTLFPEAIDPNAALRISDRTVASVTGYIRLPLATGENRIGIDILAQDKQTKSRYLLTVLRRASTNAFLSQITVTPGTFSKPFARDRLLNSISVPAGTGQILVAAIAEDSTASITVNNIPIPENDSVRIDLTETTNLVYISVIAQDPAITKNYILNVTVKP